MRVVGKLKLLDLFCCAGGAGMGYHQAGFDVTGVDISPQPHYPFAFMQADALQLTPAFLMQFDAIHASPPCQAHTLAQRIRGNSHPDLIDPTRDLLRASGRPYIIENVEGAPLIDPVMLCGSMFPGLQVYRHRLFETSFPVSMPPHGEHIAPLRKMGRRPEPGDFMHVVGNFSGVEQAKVAMGIDWMVRDELREAIPPAFTEFLGRQLLEHVQNRLPSMGWLAMDSAPRDGSPVLLYGTRFGWKAAASRVCGFWNGQQWWIYGAASGEPGSTKCATQTIDTVDPIMWMPLPDKPEAA